MAAAIPRRTEVVVGEKKKQSAQCDSSGVYKCKSVVNDLRHGNLMCIS
jgi:hypothetical protein